MPMLFDNLNFEKNVDVDGDSTPDITVRYAYDGWKPGDGFIGNENWDVWGDFNSSDTLVNRYMRGDTIDQLFARIDDSGDPYWLLTDHLGSVRDVVDNTGTVVKTVSYDGYGNIISQSGSGSLGRYGWTGREIETETGLQYNRARYYNSTIGRWTSQDPLGFDAGDTNLYRYVNNAPTMATDPSGLQRAVIGSADRKNVRFFVKGISVRGQQFNISEDLELLGGRNKKKLIPAQNRVGVTGVGIWFLYGNENGRFTAYALKYQIDVPLKVNTTHFLMKNGKWIPDNRNPLAQYWDRCFGDFSRLGKDVAAFGKQVNQAKYTTWEPEFPAGYKVGRWKKYTPLRNDDFLKNPEEFNVLITTSSDMFVDKKNGKAIGVSLTAEKAKITVYMATLSMPTQMK